MKSPRPNRYHLLSIAEKRTEALTNARENPITCQECDMRVMPADLISHMESRCPGPSAPAPGSRWLSGREARAIGVAKSTLSFWANRGFVRVSGEGMDRRYLERDLVKSIQISGIRMRNRRRSSNGLNRGKR